MSAKPLRVLTAPAVLVILLGVSSCSTSMAAQTSRTSTVSHSTVSTSEVARFVNSLKARSAPGGVLESVRAVLVLARGRTVVEFYKDSSATTSHNVYSVTKGVLSTLIGIALAEGRLKSVNQTLGELLPAHAHDMNPHTSTITLRQLLTMTSGLPYDPSPTHGLGAGQTGDWVGGILQRGGAHAPGTFAYSSPGSHLLSAILVRATGMSVLDYARAKLFDPLGIVTRPAVPLAYVSGSTAYKREYDKAGFTWPVDPQGTQLGYSELKLRPVDLAKFGQAYLDGGRWRGRQVIPAAWVHEATKSQVASQGVAGSYGYQWWNTSIRGAPAYFAFGFRGQMVMVVPNRQMVVVVSTAADAKIATAHLVQAQTLASLVASPIATAIPVQK